MICLHLKKEQVNISKNEITIGGEDYAGGHCHVRFVRFPGVGDKQLRLVATNQGILLLKNWRPNELLPFGSYQEIVWLGRTVKLSFTVDSDYRTDGVVHVWIELEVLGLFPGSYRLVGSEPAETRTIPPAEIDHDFEALARLFG